MVSTYFTFSNNVLSHTYLGNYFILIVPLKSEIIKNWKDKDKARLYSSEATTQNEYVSSVSITQHFVITYRTSIMHMKGT